MSARRPDTLPYPEFESAFPRSIKMQFLQEALARERMREDLHRAREQRLAREAAALRTRHRVSLRRTRREGARTR